MNKLAALLLPTLLLAAEIPRADTLAVMANAADVTVQPAADGMLRLPDLEIDTSIAAECDEGQRPETLSVSSADSIRQIALDAEEPEGNWQFLFALPANQVPPVIGRDFCAAGAETEAAASLHKKAFVSIRASMRCRADGEDRVTTQTALVDVTLICDYGEMDFPGQDSPE